MKSQYDVVSVAASHPHPGSARGSRADFGGSPKFLPHTRLHTHIGQSRRLARPPITAREATCAPQSTHHHMSSIAPQAAG